MVETVAYKLGVSPSYLSAELDKLLYVEKGGHIERGSDNEDVLGSLFIQLPSKFKGGEMTVYNANSSFKFPLGAGGDATYSCYFACHFSDCEYAFASLSSESRVLLRYSLLYNEAGGFPTASQINESVSTLKWSLSGLPPVDRMIVYPLKKEYRVHDLLNTGINGLSRVHRKKAEALKAAGRDWELLNGPYSPLQRWLQPNPNPNSRLFAHGKIQVEFTAESSTTFGGVALIKQVWLP